MDTLTERLEQNQGILRQLISAPRVPFDGSLHSKLPGRHGVYVISVKGSQVGDVLRGGRTDEAADGLRQRIYRNHLMGHQSGNLRSQLVQNGVCADLQQAKAWIRNNCEVQWLVVEDDLLRRWAEHFMLSVLRPKYCD